MVFNFVTGYSKPRLECPKDVIAELPPGRDEAFVTFDQPSTDLDWFRYVRSKPSWGTRLEANLTPGVHEITFFARHPVSKKQASCVLRIIVKEETYLQVLYVHFVIIQSHCEYHLQPSAEGE
ncbi:hypothetical protein E2986_11990 [Frieseomelitta varia]|uniref:Uncharacterized protein n=1 Tax=Frieseomelitta varia TaxID=561572 RepID=A0A833R7B4_9HYME|nr:hypothetical protein E2986_11990 [Frieseomelitta varia]